MYCFHASDYAVMEPAAQVTLVTEACLLCKVAQRFLALTIGLCGPLGLDDDKPGTFVRAVQREKTATDSIWNVCGNISTGCTSISR